MNYCILNIDSAPSREGALFFTTDRTVGRDASLLCPMLGVEEGRFARPHQTHTDHVLRIGEEFFALQEAEREALMEGVDAVISDVKGAVIGISTADCIPVVVWDRKRNVAAAIHAGWRGTVQRIVEKAVKELKSAFGSDMSDCEAVVGPGISLESFEVGDEVFEAFEREFPEMEGIALRMPAFGGLGEPRSRAATNGTRGREMACGFDATNGARGREMACGFEGANGTAIQEKWHIDLKEVNRRLLVGCGVPAGNIRVSEVDTFTDGAFFSARREQKGDVKCGRILSGFVLR